MAGRVTPSAGACCPAVMAAVAEAEQWQRLLGAVTRLQVGVPGGGAQREGRARARCH